MLSDTHYKEGKKVKFKKYEINIAGLLFCPKNFNEKKKYPAIVVVHPGGGVKEQCASLQVWNLSQNGYIALCFDASYQGESEGTPRYLELPESRVEDINSAIDYLVTLKYVDENKIGLMGICAGGGYAMNAAQTDFRVKACAGVSTYNLGYTGRLPFPGLNIDNYFEGSMKGVVDARNKFAKSGEIVYPHYCPDKKEEINEHLPVLFREGFDYYKTPRCSFPTSVNKYILSCNAKLAAWDAFQYIDMISPRPVLFIVGSKADSKFFSEKAISKAKEPKELFQIQGATHIDLYDKPEYVTQVVKKLANFFDKYVIN